MLVTTLTKRMAEDLTEYLDEHGVKVRYLHSDIETVERVEIIRDLRLGKFDVLVGINLLREGLDMPEVSLVAILDADKEGFLRSEGSLIQTIGRAARNVHGAAILYADRITGSMERAIDETNRRRERAARLQRRARHHAEVDPQGRQGHHGRRALGRAGRVGDAARGRAARRPSRRCSRSASSRRRCSGSRATSSSRRPRRSATKLRLYATARWVRMPIAWRAERCR